MPIITSGIIIAERLPSEFFVSDASLFNINTALPVSIHAENDNVSSGYNAQLKLMGVIPIKNISIRVVEQKYVSLCGTPFGVKIFTDGVMVVGLGDIYTEKGTSNPAKKAKIEIGDIIVSINNKEVYNNNEVAKLIETSNGKPLELVLIRHGKKQTCTLTAVLSTDDGLYKAGMWIRDSSAGIGTLTFINEKENTFGGLGHGICDIDTGNIIPLSCGEIVPVTLTEITKSSAGKPGELKGFLNDTTLGNLCANSEKGVYGNVVSSYTKNTYAVAPKHEIIEGDALVLTTLPGKETKFYSCKIEKINYDQKNLTRNLIVKITDEQLLDITGGIGSPIVQNGKFIGAITHVFVNNPALGYGIFAENMLTAAEQYTANSKIAS